MYEQILLRAIGAVSMLSAKGLVPPGRSDSSPPYMWSSGRTLDRYVSSLPVSLPLFPAGVVKKPDAADREGMPLTCSTLSDETQCLAKAVDPGG